MEIYTDEYKIFEETISDYKDLFNEFISGSDIKKIHEDLKISKSTIYTYFNGGVPNTQSARNTENMILLYCKELLLKRGELLVKTLK